MLLNSVLRAVLPNKGRLEPTLNLDPINREIESPITAGDFIFGETTCVFSGPPLLSMAIRYPKYLYGLTMSNGINVSQSKANIPWTEFGYMYERTLPGKVRYNIGIDKVLTGFEDLKYALYKWMVMTSHDRKNADMLFYERPGHNPNNTAAADSVTSYRHYSNLSSELFNIPFGLLIVQMDQANNVINSNYAELCHLPSASLGLNGSAISSEGVNINATRVVPAYNLKTSAKAKRPYTLKAPLVPIILPKDKAASKVLEAAEAAAKLLSDAVDKAKEKSERFPYDEEFAAADAGGPGKEIQPVQPTAQNSGTLDKRISGIQDALGAAARDGALTGSFSNRLNEVNDFITPPAPFTKPGFNKAVGGAQSTPNQTPLLKPKFTESKGVS